MRTTRNEAIGVTIHVYQIDHFTVHEYLYDDHRKEIRITPDDDRLCPELRLLNYAESISYFDKVMPRPEELVIVGEYLTSLANIYNVLKQKYVDL